MLGPVPGYGRGKDDEVQGQLGPILRWVWPLVTALQIVWAGHLLRTSRRVEARKCLLDDVRLSLM